MEHGLWASYAACAERLHCKDFNDGTFGLYFPEPTAGSYLVDWRRTEKRRHPRFKLDVEIKINSRSAGDISGHALGIGEFGMSAILVIEVPVGEVVQLEFKLPTGRVKVLAFVRNKTAFRYGFEFVRPNAAQAVINSGCAVLPRSESPDL
jgi:hypothetical protein